MLCDKELLSHSMGYSIAYENTRRSDRFLKSALAAGVRQALANGLNQTVSFNQVIDHASEAQRLTRELMSAHCFDEAQSVFFKTVVVFFDHAACFISASFRSGFRVTWTTGVQFLVAPDQRAGCRFLAWA
jgi:hypothetical protein